MAITKSGPIKLKVRNSELRDVMGGIVRVDISHRPFAKAGKILVVQCGASRALAVARGSSKGGKETIALDSVLREGLGVKVNEEATFSFKKASIFDEFMWAWSSSDAMPRIAARMGIISLVLGFVGFVLGIISLVQSC